MKPSKIFLTIAILTGVIGVTPAGGDFLSGVLRPISAVMLVLFFACLFVEHAEQDHEEQTAGVQPRPQVARTEDEAHAHELTAATH
jgi:hypothetical protein